MEGCPKLPMMKVKFKISPESVNFSQILLHLIREIYKEDPTQYSQQISLLNALREDIVVSLCAGKGPLTKLKQYYKQLFWLTKHFPSLESSAVERGQASKKLSILSNKRKHREGVEDEYPLYSWQDLTYPNSSEVSSSIILEKVSILHNIAVSYSFLAEDSMDYTTTDGLKAACSHFQSASSAFKKVIDELRSMPQMRMDESFSEDLYNFYKIVMMAQAQECILHKSLLDHKSATVISKISFQLAQWYDSALAFIDGICFNSFMETHSYSIWHSFIKFKGIFYQSLSYLHQSMHFETQKKWGVSYAEKVDVDDYKSYESLLFTEAIEFLRDLVIGKLTSLTKENDFIYHEVVPKVSDLPSLTAVSLVKGVDTLDIFGPNDTTTSDRDKMSLDQDLFATLLPFYIHEAHSIYSEKKAQLFRDTDLLVTEKDKDLDAFLSSLKVSGVQALTEPQRYTTLDTLEVDCNMPQALIHVCAEMSVKIADSGQNDFLCAIENNISQVEQLSGRAHKQVSGIASLYYLDSAPEKNEFESLNQKLKEAIVFDEKLKQVWMEKKKLITLLSSPLEEIHNHLPSFVPFISDESDRKCVERIERISAKIREMKEQRDDLIQAFKNEIKSDDISSILISSERVNFDEVFDTQLLKFSNMQNVIHQNLNAQKKILDTYTDVHACFVKMKKSCMKANQERIRVANDLVESFEVFKKLEEKIKEGKAFYTALIKSLDDFEGRMNKKKTKANSPSLIVSQNIDSINSTLRTFVTSAAASKDSQVRKTGTLGIMHPKHATNTPKLKDYLPLMPKNNNQHFSAMGAASVLTHVPSELNQSSHTSQQPYTAQFENLNLKTENTPFSPLFNNQSSDLPHVFRGLNSAPYVPLNFQQRNEKDVKPPSNYIPLHQQRSPYSSPLSVNPMNPYSLAPASLSNLSIPYSMEPRSSNQNTTALPTDTHMSPRQISADIDTLLS